VFFAEQTPAAIAAAISDFETNSARITAQACRENAMRFGVERFRREFAACVASEWSTFTAGQAQ
jgi:hypothetical protein